ncbi:MAG: AbiEi antitoxin N-terminal domain-containing protein [Bdellovibrionales bacterium]|nr:AbiEi antitoxin N-terminal domain-containing protein [Bdellovibrionales bacterium]
MNLPFYYKNGKFNIHMPIDSIPNSLKTQGLLTAQKLRNRLGVSQPTLSRLVKSGSLRRFSHGLYAHPDCAVPPEEIDFAVACARFAPTSAIGGLSALFHYGLLDQPPHQIWVVILPQKSDHNDFYRTLRTKTSPKYGIDVFKFYRMTNIERTLLEALKFAPKIGPRIAISAARMALQKGLTTEKKLGEMAKKLKLKSVLEKYWEAIVI